MTIFFVGNLTQYFAVNLNTRESNLERYDSQLLPSQFAQEEKAHVAGLPSVSGASGSQLFQYVLVFVLVLLFAESTLAWMFGRQRV